jgi:putative membrane protein
MNPQISYLPTIDAVLNATSALLLTLGYIFIRRGNVRAHKTCMLSAVGTSALFLACYLTYHYFHGTTRFTGQGAVRPIYFAILISHTVLAAAIVPLVVTTLYRALRGRFALHRRIARWTLPAWLYVSVTGVVVYWMLYHLYPPR